MQPTLTPAAMLAGTVILLGPTASAAVIFDNTLNGTGSVDPDQTATFALKESKGRGFAFDVDQGFSLTLSSLKVGLYAKNGNATGSIEVVLYELDSSFAQVQSLGSETFSNLSVLENGSFIDLTFDQLDDLTLQGGTAYGIKITNATSDGANIRGIQSTSNMVAGTNVTWGSYVRANDGEWHLNNAAQLGQLNGTMAASVVPGPAAAMTLLVGVGGLARRRRR